MRQHIWCVNSLWVCVFTRKLEDCISGFRCRPRRSPEADVVSMMKERSAYYGTACRPVADFRDAVTINMTLRLIQVDVDETSNTLRTSVWVRFVSIWDLFLNS